MPRQNETPAPELTPAQLLALEALLAGRTVTDAAVAASVARQTVHRWLADDVAFAAELNARRLELRDAAQGRLFTMAQRAAEAVEKAITAGDLRVSLTLLEKLGLLAPPQIGPGDAAALAKIRKREKKMQDLTDAINGC
jgi:hypothetical protein